MNAFIYAAGRATRLGAAYANRPKILLEFGGRTLLEWHVLRLREVGVRDIAVVTGWRREQVTGLVPRLEAEYDVRLREIPNPDFTEGSALSVHASLPAIQSGTGDVLVMDGDVLYPTEMLVRLLGSRYPTVLLIDQNYSTDDDDPVLVPAQAGRPFEFAKRWQGVAEVVGESIGFFRVARADVPLLAAETKRRAVGRGRLESYDEIIRAMVQKRRFGYEDVTGLPWTEIDFPKDIEYAETEVLPAILRLPLPSVVQ